MPRRTRITRWSRRAVALGAAVVVILCGMVAAFSIAGVAGYAELRKDATGLAQSRAQTLESVLAQQRAVAAIISDDEAVRAALRKGGLEGHEEVSRKLERLRRETRGAVIYLLDLKGRAIAASNWDEPASFVGSGYGFRSYFTEALRDVTALQFALGTVSHRPGLYLSHSVLGDEGLLGVVVVKVEFDALEATWAAGPGFSAVSDPSGEVVISGRPEARFQPLAPLDTGVLEVTLPLSPPGWHLTHRVTEVAILRASLSAAALAGTALLLTTLGIARLLQSRWQARTRIEEAARQRDALEAAVAERTRALEDEMTERRRAEQRLAGMQADLVQANKLATLGQVTAGLAHEVNQPLYTIRLLAESARRMLPKRGTQDVDDNLASIIRMSERIGQVTTELRSFARKATGEIRPVPLREVIEASVLLTASRLRAEGARITLSDIPPGLTVRVEAVRLEQVLVNLIQNAQEALSGRPDPQIILLLTDHGDRIELAIQDNGPGLGHAIAEQLFTPFATSKPHGLGLGLVIAQEILREFGGDLRADPPVAGQGATFRIDLPKGA